jgi:hypothetical protein
MGSTLPDMQLWLGFAICGKRPESSNRSEFRADRASGAMSGAHPAAIDWKKRGVSVLPLSLPAVESDDLREWHAIA